jgi:hypothetical protein
MFARLPDFVVRSRASLLAQSGQVFWRWRLVMGWAVVEPFYVFALL